MCAYVCVWRGRVCVCKGTVGRCVAGNNASAWCMFTCYVSYVIASLQCSRVGVTGMKLSKQMWESFIIHY